MMKMNKKAADFSFVLVFVVIAVVVMTVLIFGFGRFWRDGTGTISAINTQASSFSISVCNSYCDYLNGNYEDLTIVIPSRDVAKYDYCNKKLKFIGDNSKEISITCKDATDKEFITGCNDLAGC
jgi:hypothetical protein